MTIIEWMDWLRPLAATMVGYGLGNIPSAGIAQSMAGAGTEALAAGSGNPGALNASRTLGRRWGLAVGAADIAKGAVAGFAGRRIAGDAGCYLAATASVGGHVHPLGRRGGKGAATSFGSCVAAFPLYAPVDIAVGAAALLARRKAPEGSRAAPAALITSASFVAAAALWSWRRWPNPGGPRSGPGLFGYAAVSALLMLPRWLEPA